MWEGGKCTESSKNGRLFGGGQKSKGQSPWGEYFLEEYFT